MPGRFTEAACPQPGKPAGSEYDMTTRHTLSEFLATSWTWAERAAPHFGAKWGAVSVSVLCACEVLVGVTDAVSQ